MYGVVGLCGAAKKKPLHLWQTADRGVLGAWGEVLYIPFSDIDRPVSEVCPLLSRKIPNWRVSTKRASPINI